MEGLDKVYEGAFESRATGNLFGPRGGKFSTPQCYSSAFNSATPRPWNRPASRDSNPRQLGPGTYDPFRDSHMLSSSSVSWQSRGRTGPVGFPFEEGRRSAPFRSTTGRMHSSLAAEKKMGLPVKEDFFVLASDARRDVNMRAAFADTLAVRVVNQHARPGLSPVANAGGGAFGGRPIFTR